MSDWDTELLERAAALEAELVRVRAVAERRLALVDEWKLRAVKAEADLDTALRHLEANLDDGECWFDHHGYCQEHYLGSPCEVAEARAFLLSMKEGSNP